MVHTRIIAFHAPLSETITPGVAGRLYTAAEYSAHGESSFRRGVDATRALADQQMVESRHAIAQLSNGVLQQLGHVESGLLKQLREQLPLLALDIARRLQAGYEPTAELIDRLCREALEQLFPERENLELKLCPHDVELLTQLNPGWLLHYPDLKILPDPTLKPGDCQVRSRFGLIDAREQTKLDALARALAVV
jgi:flagellar assembly protein FliH